MFCISAVTPSAGVISLTPLYLSTPQRATHSRNSSKSSTDISSVDEASAAPIWSRPCESMKAALTCGTESRQWYSVLQLGSPEMSDSRC